jgi:antitoxin component of RelBE/YafQ-DinJ toxin-antitoxin module
MAAISKIELLRVRIDRGRTARTAKILKRYGLTPGQAVKILYAKIEQVGRIPFDPPNSMARRTGHKS